ncbi:uncharacterized protein [Parasteatoda tepidariorum]|uniref:uncharacterized protein n=1 Tax=Parasteatoda tepidariorum TaxID=114398 RepID=UPI00077FC27C|nr:protein HAIKU1-like [Parasteatoda tepidariorum]
MFKTVIFICLVSLALCQQYSRQRAPPRQPIPEYEADYDDYQPRSQPPPPPPARVSPNSVRLRPASVHYVNIGTELAGDYKFGYDTGKGDDGQSFREETRLPDGTVQGAYGYVDEAGVQRIVKYTAGKDGFKIIKDGEEGSRRAASQASPQQPPSQPARAAPYVPPPQPTRAPAYVPPPQPARAPAYVPPPQPARPPVQNYAPAPQPARPRPVQRPEPSYRAEPVYRPEPVPQRAYAPAPQKPSKRQYTPRKPIPEDEPDYDYPDNDIQERRLVVVDTTLFNYNIGSNNN